MKNTHKLCGAALLAVLGLAVAAPNATKAESGDHTGAGVVEFEKDTTPDTVHIPDTTDTIPDSEIDINTEDGDLKIVAITKLDFEKHAILADQSDQTYKVKPYETSVGTMEHFVDFKDVRSTTDHTYHIYGQLTQQFTHTNGVLKGATIDYSKIRLSTNGTANAELLKPVDASPVTSATLAPAADGVAAGNQVRFFSNTDASKGFGQYKIAFGNRANGVDEIKEAVQLNVPGHNVKFEGQYSAVITWTIADAPL